MSSTQETHPSEGRQVPPRTPSNQEDSRCDAIRDTWRDQGNFGMRTSGMNSQTDPSPWRCCVRVSDSDSGCTEGTAVCENHPPCPSETEAPSWSRHVSTSGMFTQQPQRNNRLSGCTLLSPTTLGKSIEMAL